MKLSDLTDAIQAANRLIPDGSGRRIDADPDIKSLHYRSQSVTPGGLFVAITGFAADGHHYIADAVSRGAVAVVAEKAPDVADVPVVMVENSRKALAGMAARYYGEPSRNMCLIGVTGTNGKTTTTYLIEAILKEAGFNVGVIGTVNYRFGGEIHDNPVTTPDSLDLQEILARMAQNRITHVVTEVSSIAIDLHRVDECWFDVGVFTNLTQDHLDFHRDMDTYWQSKKRFFTDILASGPKNETATAVINCSDEKGRTLFDHLSLKKVSVGTTGMEMVSMAGAQSRLSGTTGTLKTTAGSFNLASSLVGSFNIENILCAAGAATALGLDPSLICRGIAALKGVPGRLEVVQNTVGKFVYVDYAHTPDALENALKTLAALKTGKMICVFGCGGNRDRGKRARMGRIAAAICDLAVITTDNPRNEDPMAILWDIEKGIEKSVSHCYSVSEIETGLSAKGYVVIPDRESAIRTAIAAAQSGDIVLIAGKGHETYQIVGNRVLDFDDRKTARRVLAAEELTA